LDIKINDIASHFWGSMVIPVFQSSPVQSGVYRLPEDEGNLELVLVLQKLIAANIRHCIKLLRLCSFDRIMISPLLQLFSKSCTGAAMQMLGLTQRCG